MRTTAITAPVSTRPAWIGALVRAAQELMPRDFVGRIEINAYLGGVANVNVLQSFKGVPDAE